MGNIAAMLMLGDKYWLYSRNNLTWTTQGQVVALIDGEQNTLSDRSINAHALTAVTTTPSITSTTPASQIYSPLFNGSTDGFYLGAHADWQSGGNSYISPSEQWTIEAKIRMSSLANALMCSTRKNAGSPPLQFGFDFYVASDGSFGFWVYSAAFTSDYVISSAGVLSANTNYDIAVTYDPAIPYLKLWLDGALISTLTSFNASFGSSFGVQIPMHVGVREDGTLHFPGRLELRVTADASRYSSAYTPLASWIAG